MPAQVISMAYTILRELQLCIYAYDVDPRTQRFLNCRTFLWADTCAPVGSQADSNGNIYAPTSDGVQAFLKFTVSLIIT
ncbi:hypothetical protein Clacol_001235 [Clathrus columnatus]|uniref:Uncharacterized protein n=1 Tax=Clathrus columnatus TaxID=1419009 RepID=A0AAV4ZXX5_9AGAM|nr:hypothetical protein Clacol_001235 [Clathrus columnatus]